MLYDVNGQPFPLTPKINTLTMLFDDEQTTHK